MDKVADDRMNRAIHHALKIGIGWGTLAYVARHLANQRLDKKQDEKLEKRLKEYAIARYPEVAPIGISAATLNGTSPEAIEQLLQEKAASHKEAGAVRAIADRFLNPIPVRPDKPLSRWSMLEPFSSDKVHPLHIILTMAALIGGGTAGYKLADKKYQKSETKELDERSAKARQEMDRMFLEEYKRTRGHEKSASDDDEPSILRKAMTGATSVYTLYAAAMLALSYAVSREQFDENDPRRIERKKLEQYAKERAMLESAPTMMSSDYAKAVGDENADAPRPKQRSSHGFELV